MQKYTKVVNIYIPVVSDHFLNLVENILSNCKFTKFLKLPTHFPVILSLICRGEMEHNCRNYSKYLVSIDQIQIFFPCSMYSMHCKMALFPLPNLFILIIIIL